MCELPTPVHTEFIEKRGVAVAVLPRKLLPGYFRPVGKSLAAPLRLRGPERLVYVRVLDPALSPAAFWAEDATK